jgi:hypothetical protein
MRHAIASWQALASAASCLPLLSLLVSLSACSASDTHDVPPSTDGAGDDATISVTEIGHHADGSPKVTQRFITRQAQLAMAAAREGKAGATPSENATTANGESVARTTEAWTLDSTCADGDSLWLYDGADRTGNMLCLLPQNTASQVVDLSTYTRMVQSCFGAFHTCRWLPSSWSGAVRSYWDPATSIGWTFTAAWFRSDDGCRTQFFADSAQNAADACVAKARYVEAWQARVARGPAGYGVVNVSGSSFPPGTSVTVKWFPHRWLSSATQTSSLVVGADMSFNASASASCVGDCGCDGRAVVIPANGPSMTVSLPDCLN